MVKAYRKVTIETVSGAIYEFTGQTGNEVFAALKGRHDIDAVSNSGHAFIPFAEVAFAYIVPDVQSVEPPADAICGAVGNCSSDIVDVGEADCMVLKS